ncbi:MAG: hypothetical protein AAF639_05855 [Chloroflexota bacterium]
MDIREIVKNELAAVVAEKSPVPFPDDIEDDALLDEFWLDSVVFTAMITSISQQVGYTPTDIVEGVFFPTTFGELVDVYQNNA